MYQAKSADRKKTKTSISDHWIQLIIFVFLSIVTHSALGLLNLRKRKDSKFWKTRKPRLELRGSFQAFDSCYRSRFGLRFSFCLGRLKNFVIFVCLALFNFLDLIVFCLFLYFKDSVFCLQICPHRVSFSVFVCYYNTLILLGFVVR